MRFCLRITLGQRIDCRGFSSPTTCHDMREPETKSDLSAMRPGALAMGAQAIGAFAVGALALGALALGAVAIGRLAIGRARIKRMEIDELVVHKLLVTDSLEIPGDRQARSG